jgi:hypothetical protein
MGSRAIEKIAVADPTQKLKTLQLKVNSAIENSGKNWRSTWNRQNKISTIQIDLPTEGYAGQSAVLEFTSQK